MIEKGLIIAVIFLFLAVGFHSVSCGDTFLSDKKSFIRFSDGNWLYVGGSGEGNYSKIQDAIDNASDDDTVFVYDDSSPYYENVIVNKSIQLIGENKNTTIIDAGGNGTTVTVDASFVTIFGFTIQKSGREEFGIGASIKIIDSNATIAGNIITNNGFYGVYCLSYDGFNVISGNLVTGNRWGICLDVSYYNEVYDNYIEDNYESGIYVGSTSFHSNTKRPMDLEYNNVHDNIIVNNGDGIFMPWSYFTNVFENEMIYNDVGIYIHAPYFNSCCYNNIYKNNIHDNYCGIAFSTYHGGVAYNNISGNNISNNSDGVYINGNVGRNTFSNNNFIRNNDSVYFEYERFFNWNHWVGNYWDKTRFLPYPIKGVMKRFIFDISWINFDWHPAQEPYDT